MKKYLSSRSCRASQYQRIASRSHRGRSASEDLTDPQTQNADRILSRWRRRVLAAMALFVGVSALEVAAEDEGYLYDDFSDGSYRDGDPITWFRNANPGQRVNDFDFDASSGDLKISRKAETFQASRWVFVDSNHSLEETSIRTQVRVEGEAGVMIYGQWGGGGNYVGGVLAPDGALYIEYDLGELVQHTPEFSDFDVVSEDVLLQLDIVGQEVSLFAWRPGESMPLRPQTSLRLPRLANAGAQLLGMQSPEEGSSVIYRFVEISPEPIRDTVEDRVTIISPAIHELEDAENKLEPTFDPFRAQQIFNAADFSKITSESGPIVAVALRRPDVLSNGTYTEIWDHALIRMSHTSREPEAISTVFSENEEEDPVLVFEGSFSLITASEDSESGPKAFDQFVELQRPFAYDPSKGHLLLEVISRSGVRTENPGLVDAYTTPIHRAYAFDPDAESGAHYGGFPMQFVFRSEETPEPTPTLVRDDFDDRAIADGDPVRWDAYGGRVSVADSRFTFTRTNNQTGNTWFRSQDFLEQKDTSVQAQLMLSGEASSVHLHAQVDHPSNGKWVAGHLDPDGQLWLEHSTEGGQLGDKVQTDLQVGQEEVILQLDVIGFELRLTDWRPGAPVPEPQLAAAINTVQLGAVGAGMRNVQTGTSLILDYIAYDSKPISGAPGLRLDPGAVIVSYESDGQAWAMERHTLNSPWPWESVGRQGRLVDGRHEYVFTEEEARTSEFRLIGGVGTAPELLREEGFLKLSYPKTFGEWELQAHESLDVESDGVWRAMETETDGEVRRALVPTSESRQFFRLHRP